MQRYQLKISNQNHVMASSLPRDFMLAEPIARSTPIYTLEAREKMLNKFKILWFEKYLLIVEQIKSVSHKNLSLINTSSKFDIHVLQELFSLKSTLLILKNKMVAIFQDGHLIK